MKLLLLLVTVSAGLMRASTERCPTNLPSTTAVRVFRNTCYQFVHEERYWLGARDYCIQVCCHLLSTDDVMYGLYRCYVLALHLCMCVTLCRAPGL